MCMTKKRNYGLKEKKPNKPLLSRMYFVDPKKRELFYLHMLLLYVKGATSYEDIRTVNNNVYPTFYDAALARQLIKTDDEWDKCLQEAIN